MKLLSIEEARARMLAKVAPLEAEDVALSEALGRVLAADVVACRDQPPFAASAMDGWAVRAADGPARLRIVGESAAGHGFTGPVKAGEAVRVFTGAPIPRGADAVVIQEDATRDGDHVVIPAVTHPRHVRPVGQDFRAGDRLLRAGIHLDPWRLSLAAAAGMAHIRVSRRPTVAILSTGEEIVEPGGAAGPFQIFNSGTTALAALARTWGARSVALKAVGDDEASTALAVAGAACDLVVTIGGASVGDHDRVKPALRTLGLELVVESVATRPGKPTWFGVLADGRGVLGLAGNPASALVGAELFLRPLLSAMQGADPAPRLIAARADTAVAANGPREHWMRAHLTHGADGVLLARVFADQDSSLVSVFAQAGALVRRPAGAAATPPGGVLEVLPLARLS
ncbi:MAG: molybdopterin molybdotransferase MoeA [Pseudomonadota bacterium]|nr:molybdopterin molybdotransferase MoeA [Pseudomonadota bacterium]